MGLRRPRERLSSAPGCSPRRTGDTPFGVLPEGDSGKRKALAYLGYEPAVTQGGNFESAGNGRLTHSIYGTIAEPTLVTVPVAGSPLAKLIDGLASLGLHLGFEGEGATSGLHVTGACQRTK